MYTNNKEAYRQAFFTAWQKHLQKQILDPIEMQLVDVINLHPEYHDLLARPDSAEQEFQLEENPFFHMSLHLALFEQIRLNRPEGIMNIYAALIAKNSDKHDVMHNMMRCLAHILWKAQESSTPPEEIEYLNLLRAL